MVASALNFMATDDLTIWLSSLKRGDPRAIEQIWREYFDKLMRLIKGRLGRARLGVADEEDIALSALNSFYDGVQAGRFPQLEDGDNLWKILVTIACRKTNTFRERSFAQKRGGGELRGESVFEDGEDAKRAAGIQQVLGREPTPDVAAMITETVQSLLNTLGDSNLEVIAIRKMEGYTNEEIAVQLDCTTRTIERKLERIRTLWSTSRPMTVANPDSASGPSN
jgi:DNA-directed RNA polymerase specialized sigma24 family protein